MFRTIVIYALWIYLYGILFPRALLSWFPAPPGSTLASINSVLYRLTEPVLAPVRRLLPTMQAGDSASTCRSSSCSSASR